MQKAWFKKTMTAAAFGFAATPMAFAQNGGPAIEGDLAFGMSRSSDTAHLVRGGAFQGDWTFTTFLQAMEFDNLGSSHNARGNLLSLNFGTSTGGGSLWSLATDGTDAGSMLYAFDGTNEAMTRVGGLSVSPDNTNVAVTGYDTGSLIVLDYTAGDGSGNGSVGGSVEVVAVADTNNTQGTAWLDDTTVLVAAVSAAGGDVNVVAYDTVGGTTSTVYSIAGFAAGSDVTDIDYNPLVSDYVYVSRSSFSGGTENIVLVLDPNTWTLVDDVDLSGSANTLREIALGWDGNDPALYMSQFGAQVDVLNLSGVGALVDDSSIDYYNGGGSSSFNGIDVALSETVAGPTTVAITEFLNSAFGADDGHEWVEIYNFGEETVSLDGWTISDEDADTWTISGGVSVEPSDFVILVGGGDSLTPEEKKLAFETNWLGGVTEPRVVGIDAGFFFSNSGDELILTNPLGTVAWSLAYDNDEDEGYATHLTNEDWDTNVYGSKDSPGIDRDGLDSTGALGYESQLSTSFNDGNAYTGVNGDFGSPFFLSEDVELDCLVLDVNELTAGEDALLDFTFGTPGTIVLAVWGGPLGETVFDDENLGLCATFDIAAVKARQRYVGLTVLGETGSGQIVRNIPAFTTGFTLRFQAAEFDTCPEECVSNLVERVVQ